MTVVGQDRAPRPSKFAIIQSQTCSRKGALVSRRRRPFVALVVPLPVAAVERGVEQLGMEFPSMQWQGLCPTRLPPLLPGTAHPPTCSSVDGLSTAGVYDIDNAELTDIKATTKAVVTCVGSRHQHGRCNAEWRRNQRTGHAPLRIPLGNGLQSWFEGHHQRFLPSSILSICGRDSARDGAPEPVLSRACKACPYINQCYEDPSDLIIHIPRLSTARLEEFVSLGLLTLNDLRQRPDVIERMTQKQRVFIEANRDDGHFEATPDIDALSGVGWLNEDVIGHLDFETVLSSSTHATW